MKRIYLLPFALLFLVSCEKEEPVKDPELDYMEYATGSGEIGSGGGIINSSDGVKIEIPPNALDNNHTISITNATKDTVINSGCRIYDFKPDGLKFSDSITITLPFEDTYLDLATQKENHGIFIMEYRDSIWVKLKTDINLSEKIATAKATHFSYYYIFFPWKWSKYYEENKNKPEVHHRIPYYNQGNSEWCAYYSMSMIAKYAGYNIKGPTFASMFWERKYDAFLAGYNIFEALGTSSKLEDLGMSVEFVFPPWSNVEALSGYIIKKLDEGFPVCVNSFSIRHSFVVTGHNQNGFIVNDPSGVLTSKVYGSVYPQVNALVPYEEFEDILGGIGTETTLVIRDKNPEIIPSATINFIAMEGIFKIADQDGNIIGGLDINGKYNPMGYSLTNYASDDNVFDGSDYFKIHTTMANSEETAINAKLYYKVDGIDILDAISVEILPNESRKDNYEEFQLKNFTNGNHILSVELRSEDSDPIDSWDFAYNIKNEYFPSDATLPQVTTQEATSVNQNSAVVGGTIDDDGGAEITDQFVFLGISSDPKNEGEYVPCTFEDNTSFSATRPGLEPNTEYFYIAVAENEEGLGYGEVKSFRTSETVNPPEVTTLDATDVTDNSATIGGIVDDNGGGSITSKGFYFGNYDDPVQSGIEILGGTGDEPFYEDLSALSSETTYYFVAYAENSAERSYGEVKSFTTDQNISPPEVTTLDATDVTDNSATIGGIVDDNGGGSITNKGFYYSNNDDPVQNGREEPSGTGDEPFYRDFIELPTDYTIYFVAFAENSAERSYGEVKSFTTRAETGTVTDIDGNEYRTVPIGEQIWMAENLVTTRLNDGTQIPLRRYGETWEYAETEAYCWPNGEEGLVQTYGVLYNWLAVETDRLCPAGWHVPTLQEWEELQDFAGGVDFAGGRLKEIGFEHWNTPNTGATDEFEFTALPAGTRITVGGGFNGIRHFSAWWCSTEYTQSNALRWAISYNIGSIDHSDFNKNDGCSVRCVQNQGE